MAGLSQSEAEIATSTHTEKKKHGLSTPPGGCRLVLMTLTRRLFVNALLKT